MRSEPSIIRGSKAIAHELGCCRRTVSKAVADGTLPAKRGFSGGKTSPLIIERKQLEDFKRGRRAD